MTEKELQSCVCWDRSPRLLLTTNTIVMVVSNPQVPDCLREKAVRYPRPWAPLTGAAFFPGSASVQCCSAELRNGCCSSFASIFRRRLMRLLFLLCSRGCRESFSMAPLRSQTLVHNNISYKAYSICIFSSQQCLSCRISPKLHWHTQGEAGIIPCMKLIELIQGPSCLLSSGSLTIEICCENLFVY